jgi:hypothetical protein
VKTGWSVENVGERCSSKHEHLCTQEPRTFSLPISPTPLLKQQLKTSIVRKVIDVTLSTLTVCSIPGHFRHLGSRSPNLGRRMMERFVDGTGTFTISVRSESASSRLTTKPQWCPSSGEVPRTWLPSLASCGGGWQDSQRNRSPFATLQAAKQFPGSKTATDQGTSPPLPSRGGYATSVGSRIDK